jgi:hypothetical protein
VLASMGVEGMGPSLAVEGATTARVFETYVERVLPPRCAGAGGGDGRPHGPQGREWVCPVPTDRLPLSHSASSQSNNLFVL